MLAVQKKGELLCIHKFETSTRVDLIWFRIVTAVLYAE